ncbi:MAG TPA: ribosome biogenesis GTP-binding protein YihA/YsxC [Oligoflexia bacterium]|nr:ribosome biogenesis GTP-binding protein YihA/YsxC [Oligoflexia bacterium]HMP48822.1 ribosome biogenesis GTP-binding protein YihA/YsxC [Oligoflexia bacterium]
MEEKYKIFSADFNYSSDSIKSFPATNEPEVAFVGRSNVGKSSLINALLERKKLARVGKTPGATKVICFYKVQFRPFAIKRGLDESPNTGIITGTLVDLPGYGYAKVSGEKRDNWRDLIAAYLETRKQLKAVVLLIDCRRELSEEDRYIIDMGREGGLIVCLTKSDKASRNEISQKKIKLSSLTKLPVESFTSVNIMGKDTHKRLQELRDTVLGYLDE